MHSVAIDGPSGAGKSTLSRHVANRLGFCYADTGALYRAVALYFKENGTEDLTGLTLDICMETDGQHVYANGRDVTGELRRHELSALASKYSALPQVRTFLLEMQRSLARSKNVIMDGRDIGTVVLPNADVKIYLTATEEDRARRRTDELLQRGQKANFAQILTDIHQRDEDDRNRAVAPLRRAPDAVLLDTTGNSFDESAVQLEVLIRERLGL